MKKPDFTKLLTVIGGILVVAVVMAAFMIQNHEYDSLLELYAKQQHQLVQNGIKPSGPSAAQLLNTGATGPTGAIGAIGPRGTTGDTGDIGSAGAAGATGATGTAGATGQPGAEGAVGAAGIAGAAGVRGPTGADGAPGGIGQAGVDGVPVLSWTYVTTAGVLKQCVRDIPFDPKAPTYNCIVVPVVAPLTPTP